MSNEIVIVSAARTPTGDLQGALKDFTAPQLGSAAIKACIDRANIDKAAIEEVVMGCVLPAGMGQAPARQAALGAGLSDHTDCTTVNKMCGSGMKAVMMACNDLKAGDYRIAIAGGMESMTNSPYLLPKARAGYRIGHQTVQDHMFLDGLEDAYEPGRLMGTYAETCAEKYHFTRAEQDEFAKASLQRAQAAQKSGVFNAEIAPLSFTAKTGTVEITQDEHPTRVSADKIPALKASFKKDGTVTAANSSSIADGAAALLLMTLGEANLRKIKPLAVIKGFATHSQAPAWFTTAPVDAIKKCLQKVGWKVADVDLFEVNEAFAVVTMAAMKELAIPHDKMNIHGGACALGHPIGASGARILVTLLHSMIAQNKRRGVAALCIGGGEATAVALELA